MFSDISCGQVAFENGDWDKFMEETVKEVCAALGVNHSASRPRCELYKLLMYETGSQCVFLAI